MVVLACCAVACGPRSASEHVAPSTVAAAESVADAEAMQEAEATLRAFFAVKGRAADSISVRIDEQSVYLTARDVHPTVAYEAGMKDRPSGITDSEVSVELSNSRWIGDEIMIDFASETAGVSYPIYGYELQLEDGTPGTSYWDGTATLENRDGEWLIDELTADSYGGELG